MTNKKRNNNNAAKVAIKAYLDQRAENDSLFAISYAKKNKNIDECFCYILGEAQKRGNEVCMTDEEVFGLAVHYYDEDSIRVSRKMPRYNAMHAATSDIELTEEEKASARQRAVEMYQNQVISELHYRARAAKAAKKASAPEQVAMPSLFD